MNASVQCQYLDCLVKYDHGDVKVQFEHGSDSLYSIQVPSHKTTRQGSHDRLYNRVIA